MLFFEKLEEKNKKMLIHKTAIIDEKAILGQNVKIGPNAIIGANVKIDDETEVGANVVIDGHTKIGKKCRIFTGAIIGTEPQDLKYRNEPTAVSIGNNCTIREYVTINRGTIAAGETKIGNGILLMAYVHVAHDCIIGDHAILANNATLAGHVEIEDFAIVGGLTPIHQFVRVGKHAIVGGASRISQDVPPFCKIAGSPAKNYGLNSIGLARRNISDETISELKKAYKIIFESKKLMSQALSELDNLDFESDEVKHFINFIKNSKRGITRD